MLGSALKWKKALCGGDPKLVLQGKWKVLRFSRRFGTVFDCVEKCGFVAIFIQLRDTENIVDAFVQTHMGYFNFKCVA